MRRLTGPALATAMTGLILAGPGAGASELESGQGTPAFSVIPRQDKLFFYPCGDCHEFLEPNTEIRLLDPDPDHPADLQHGGGEVWCTSCHSQSPYETLHTLLGEPVGYDESYRVCGGCHSHKLRDWKHGAHGKRVENWQGDRQIFGCPECHNPHRPQIAPRAPLPAPPVRAGLERIDGHAEKEAPIWHDQPAEENGHER